MIDLKPPMIRKLVVEALGTLLQVPGEDISNYRVPPGSNYGPTITNLATDPVSCLSKLDKVDVRSLDNNAADILFTISQHPDWSAGGADDGSVAVLFSLIDEICQELLRTPGRKPVVSENFMIAVDGSRMSHTAFDVCASLRAHSKLVVRCVTLRSLVGGWDVRGERDGYG